MQNKKQILWMTVLVLLVGAAAFVAGRLLNNPIGPLGRLGFGGKGGVTQVELIPAKELPQAEPAIVGLFAERDDNILLVQSTSLKTGGQGVVVHKGENGEVSASPNMEYGPKVEVVITNETIIYLDSTQLVEPASAENTTIQQTVEKTSLDKLSPQSYVMVWGRKSGDRIIAEVILINRPMNSREP